MAKTSMDHLRLVDHEFARALLAYSEAKSGLYTYGERFFEPTEEGREVYLEDRLYSSWGCATLTPAGSVAAAPTRRSQSAKHPELRFRALLADGAREVRFERAVVV